MENVSYTHLDNVSVQPERKKESHWQHMFWGGVFMLVMLMVMAYVTSGQFIAVKEKNLHRDIEQRLTILARNESEVFNTWLSGKASIGNRITEAQIVQMFASDVNSAGTLEDIPEELLQELPYMQAIIEEFVKQNKLLSAYLINAEGRPFVANNESESLMLSQRIYAKSIFETSKSYISPIYASGNKLVIDFAVPVKAPQKNMQTGKQDTVAVLKFSLDVSKRLEHFLQANAFSNEGEETYLIQENNGALEFVNYMNKSITSYNSGTLPLDFAKRSSVFANNKNAVFSVDSMVGEDMPFYMVQEIDAQIALQPLYDYKRNIFIASIFLVVIVLTVLLAVWWHHREAREHALLLQFKDFASKLNAQRRLLASINNSIKERIGLKDVNGKYTYVNPAFAESLDMKVEDVIGSTDDKLFGKQASAHLEKLDTKMLAEKKAISSEDSFVLNDDKRHYWEVSKSPIYDHDDELTGIVSVTRDVTELVEERKMREKAMKNTVRAMMRIVERHDRYLVKRSNYLSRLVNAMAEHMSLTREEKLTLEISSNLTQIGKIFIPQEILQDNRTLKGAKLKTYQTHVEHTAFVLDTVSWELPVVDTIYKMHEKLDGSGYPNGYKGDQISMLSRVLSVCNAYCAMVHPRGHNKFKTPEKAMETLVQNAHQFDQEIVSIFIEVMQSDESLVTAG